MLSKISVKKPYTVLVGVILVIVLGVVAFMKMSADLLPDINLPYVVVLTTYGGASPETVETVVTAPVEASMATISNIEGITSMSSENYSVVILEFSQKADMDSVSLDMRESLDQLESYWPEEVGSPIIMKLNPNMLPTMIAAVGMDDMTQAEVSDFVEDTIVPEIESIEGVASVSTTGIVDESLNVVISEDKVAKINKEVCALIDEEFEEAYEEIEKGRQEIADGEEELVKAEDKIKDGERELNAAEGKIASGKQELNDKKASTTAELANTKLQLLTAKADLESAKTSINTDITTLETLTASRTEVAAKRPELVEQKKQLEETLAQLEGSVELITVTVPGAISGYQAAFMGGMMTEAEANAALAALKSQLSQSLIAADIATINFVVTNPTLLDEYNAVASGYATSPAYVKSKEQLESGISQIDAGIAQIDEGLENIDNSINSITLGLGVDAYIETQNNVLAQLSSTMATVDNGILQVYQGETEAVIGFATGISQLDLASYQITASKAELETGKKTLEDSKKQISDAKEQLDDAEVQLEDAKADAKEKADMTGVLTIDTVSSLLTAQNFSMPAGYVEDTGDTYLVRVGDKPSTEDELKDMVLMKLPLADDKAITLADVAEIFTVSNADETYTNVNGKPGVVLSIQKQTGFSTGNVSDDLKDKFNELRDRYEGSSIIELMDQGVYIDLVMNTIFENVLVGGALAILILIFFLRDIRPTLVIAISIPVSLIAAIVCMYFSGVTLNIISLSGLALGVGMLVDNSIVVIENIYRLRNLGTPPKEAAIEGAREVAGAIFASTLTTVCVFLPIVFTEGLTRQLFVDMGLTIAYSLMASLLVALTVVPACAAGMLKKMKKPKHEGKGRFYRGYEKFLRGCLKVKPLVLLLTLALLGISAYGAYTNGMAYFPDMESPQITVTLSVAEDSEVTDVKEQTNTMVERLANIPDVVDIGAMASSSTMSLFGASSSDEVVTSATIYVTTTEDRAMSSEELVRAIKDQAADMEGIEVSVETSTMDMSALGGEGISLELKGRDLDVLYELANQAQEIIGNTEGVAKVSADIEDASPELRVHVDKEKAAMKGLTVATVYMQVAAELKDPAVATTLTTTSNDISVYVEDETKQNLTRNDIKNLKIKYTNDDGEEVKIPLKDIAEFEDGVGMDTIHRIDQTRYVGISATLAEGYNITFVSADVEKNMEALELPDGYSLEYTGENEMIVDALQQLSLMLVLAVVFIYLIMVAQFQSLGSPFIIMFTIPLAFTGGLAALYFTGFELSIVAMIGFVMLSGIIVNNGIVLVDYINQRRAEGLSKREAIIDAGVTRLRPVLMTALTTILALFTMAFSTQMGADMTRPLAIVVIGGMVYGTLMTLIVVPCIYDMFMREKTVKRKPGETAPADKEVEPGVDAEPVYDEVSDTVPTVSALMADSQATLQPASQMQDADSALQPISQMQDADSALQDDGLEFMDDIMEDSATVTNKKASRRDRKAMKRDKKAMKRDKKAMKRDKKAMKRDKKASRHDRKASRRDKEAYEGGADVSGNPYLSILEG